MTENVEVPDALVAIGDQIQETVSNSLYPIAAVIILAEDGNVEIRAQLDEPTMREALFYIAETF